MIRKKRINQRNQQNVPARKKARADVKRDAKLAFVDAARIPLDAVTIVIARVIAAMCLTTALMSVPMRHMLVIQQMLLRTKKMSVTMKLYHVHQNDNGKKSIL